MDDLIVPSTPPPTADSEEMQGNVVSPEYGLHPHENQVE